MIQPSHPDGPRDRLGVAISDLQVAVCQPKGIGVHSVDVYPGSEPIPPAAICGELAGEAVTADLCYPPHIRGSGMSWPPSARVLAESGSARLPASIAWALLDHAADDTWKWETPGGRVEICRPADALAEIAQSTLARLGGNTRDQCPTLVVPNTLDTEAQDTLLRSLAWRGIEDAYLLWRPIAASLAWIWRFGATVVKGEATEHGPLGAIWTIHLGLDSFEVSQIELLIRNVGSNRVVVPARRLPVFRTLYGEGLTWAEHLASQATAGYDENGAAAWNLLWTTPWLQRTLAVSQEAKTHSDHAPARGTLHEAGAHNITGSDVTVLLDELMKSGAIQPTSGSQRPRLSQLRSTWADLKGPFTQKHIAASQLTTSFADWLADVRSGARRDVPCIGYVGTGTLAGVQGTHATLAEMVARFVENRGDHDQAIIEGKDCRVGQALASGAALCAERQGRGIPAYLDTLPRLESVIQLRGEPTWVDLLGAKNRYVMGGQEWLSEPESEGYCIPKETKQLVLSVWREGHETVREVRADLPGSLDADVDAGLQIRMMPGQGHARVEVKPVDESVFGGRRAYLDWKRATDTGASREEILDREPRTNPPLEPRQASLEGWRGGWWTAPGGAREAVQEFLRDAPSLGAWELADRLRQVRAHLWRTDSEALRHRPPDHATALSSDGLLHDLASGEEAMREFISILDDALVSQQYAEAHEEIFRTLGYCSADSNNLRESLAGIVRSQKDFRQYHIVAMGNCLRSPDQIRAFFETTVAHIGRKGKPPYRTEWLKAIARLLQYRASATEDLDSDDCWFVSRYCLQVMEEEIDNRKAAFLFRYASLCVVYLLRRRKYDVSYLGPGESRTERAKKVFEKAIQRHDEGRLKAIGGIVDLPTLMKMMIDYIDRRGRGRLIGLAVAD
ncbi:MAG: hypothetical protein GF393_03320 [Armatimonadia bacterium]|nr:hypothetical protein [Armatimonadia bacterium]